MTDVAEAPPVPSTSAQPTIDASSATTHSPGTRQLEPEHAPPLENPEWGLKEILWPPEVWENQPQRRVRIVTQNANGPCSFIAICNILILRGAITILPPDRPSASYEYLSALVGDYLVNTALDLDIASVFSVLPKTQHGMDLNPLFTGVSSFRPGGEGGELKLFDLAGIRLVHGWLVDPDSQEYPAVSITEDYDTSLNAIVEADILTSGQVVYSDHQRIPSEQPKELSPEEGKKIVEAMLIKQWLDSNPTQLTYYGLFALNDTEAIAPNELACFFRGSHLSVLYKRQMPGSSDTMLYTLVTDRVFLREPDVVWESLVDVDGQSSSFFDSHMVKATPAGGDFAGQTSEQVVRAHERMEAEAAMSDDFRLARQLQFEEDQHARQLYQQQQAQFEAERRNAVQHHVPGDLANGMGPRMPGPAELTAQRQRDREKKDKRKSKGDCIIM